MNKDALAEQLKRHEGMRLKPYYDTVGVLTIGIGRNLKDVGITEQEALFMLKNDIDLVEKQLDENLPWWKKLSDKRQQVLANMAFNLGIKGLLGFRNTLSLIQSGRYIEAGDAMLQSKWAKQVGNRAVELSNMMKEG